MCCWFVWNLLRSGFVRFLYSGKFGCVNPKSLTAGGRKDVAERCGAVGFFWGRIARAPKKDQQQGGHPQGDGFGGELPVRHRNPLGLGQVQVVGADSLFTDHSFAPHPEG